MAFFPLKEELAVKVIYHQHTTGTRSPGNIMLRKVLKDKTKDFHSGEKMHWGAALLKPTHAPTHLLNLLPETSRICNKK